MARNSYLLQVSRNSTLKEASRTSPRDARLAVTQERTQLRLRENSLPPLALIAEKKLRFLSSPATTDRSTAASATRQWNSNNPFLRKYCCLGLHPLSFGTRWSPFHFAFCTAKNSLKITQIFFTAICTNIFFYVIINLLYIIELWRYRSDRVNGQ